MSTILASVGMGGENRRRDVVAIQSMLQTVGISPGPVDGRCGRRTIGAIEQFQRGVIRRPDGRIDVRGPTIRQLAARSLAARTSPGRKPEVSAGKRAETMDAARTALTVPDKRSASPSKGTVAYWQERTLLPGPAVNAGLICPNSSQMMTLLGDPNGQRVKSLIATESVGPFRATGLKPALHSLRTILAQVGRQHPDLYHIVGSNGMHVIRQTRKSQSYSNHAWGIAIDLLIGGKSPMYGDNFSYRGLSTLVPFFHQAGWYWGGGYRSISRKDAMHFECGLALVRSFQQ